MLPIARVIGHKEWSPGRKSDPVYDMNWRRAGVAGIRPKSSNPAPPSEDDMPSVHDIWHHPIPDEYPGAKGPMPAFAALAFATARASLALDAASRAERKIDAMASKLATSPAFDQAAITAAVREAAREVLGDDLAEQVIEALAAKLAAR